MKKYSSTLISDPDRKLTGAAVLKCECDWKNTISNCITISIPNARAALQRRLYCCPRCFTSEGDVIILLEDTFSPGLTLIEQANGAADREPE